MGDGVECMPVIDAPKVDFEYECIFFLIHISLEVKWTCSGS